MDGIMTWVGPTLDVLAVGLLTAVLWRLGRDPGAGWAEREERLQGIFGDLRALVAQSEGLARDLDGKLAEREGRLQALLVAAESAAAGREPAPLRATAPAPMPASDDRNGATREAGARASEPAALATEIEALADGGMSVDDIARRLGVAAAEVRLVIGLKAARAARRRAASTEARAHA